MADPPLAPDRGGRPATTSAREIAVAAQNLFVTKGFDETNVDDIADAAGVSRRTFFRYFRTKADVLFLESPAELDRLRAGLDAGDPAADYRDVVTDAVVEALRVADADREWALQRARVILSAPSLQAHAAVRFALWRGAAADYARRRFPDDDLFATVVGHAVLAATLAAHEYWTEHPQTDVAESLTAVLRLLLPPARTA